MKQIDMIKSQIQDVDDPMELAGFLDGIKTAAAIYCQKYYPDEVIFENGRLVEITIYGMSHYLDSSINERDSV